MNEELKELLRDVFLGAIFLDNEEVQGIHFDESNDGSMLLNIRCIHHISLSEEWHYILVPSENTQALRLRLASVPGVARAARK
jgi:hypothetical protein